MSSKLVKRGLDFVLSSTDEYEQEKHKQKSKKTSARNEGLDSPRRAVPSHKKGKIKKEQDFTNQNLKYFKSSSWSIKKETYEKILQHQDKRRKKKKTITQDETEETE